MRKLDHPFKGEIQAIRSAILGVDSCRGGGRQVDAPSFRTTDYFATTESPREGRCRRHP